MQDRNSRKHQSPKQRLPIPLYLVRKREDWNARHIDCDEVTIGALFPSADSALKADPAARKF